jgi:hypothetical protein
MTGGDREAGLAGGDGGFGDKKSVKIAVEMLEAFQ